jgi:hypothetical protein
VCLAGCSAGNLLCGECCLHQVWVIVDSRMQLNTKYSCAEMRCTVLMRTGSQEHVFDTLLRHTLAWYTAHAPLL